MIEYRYGIETSNSLSIDRCPNCNGSWSGKPIDLFKIKKRQLEVRIGCRCCSKVIVLKVKIQIKKDNQKEIIRYENKHKSEILGGRNTGGER